LQQYDIAVKVSNEALSRRRFITAGDFVQKRDSFSHALQPNGCNCLSLVLQQYEVSPTVRGALL
jgi:hypothetical protein